MAYISALRRRIPSAAARQARATLSPGNGRGVTIITPISQPSATANLVEGNLIGTDPTGTKSAGPAPVPPGPMPSPSCPDCRWGNIGDGVFISSAPGNTIGGTDAGARNVVSSNGAAGVEIYEAGINGKLCPGQQDRDGCHGTSCAGQHGRWSLHQQCALKHHRRNDRVGAEHHLWQRQQRRDHDGNRRHRRRHPGQPHRHRRDGSDNENSGNDYDGVRVSANSSGATIGGTAAGAANIIAHNRRRRRQGRPRSAQRNPHQLHL